MTWSTSVARHPHRLPSCVHVHLPLSLARMRSRIVGQLAGRDVRRVLVDQAIRHPRCGGEADDTSRRLCVRPIAGRMCRTPSIEVHPRTDPRRQGRCARRPVQWVAARRERTTSARQGPRRPQEPKGTEQPGTQRGTPVHDRCSLLATLLSGREAKALSLRLVVGVPLHGR